MNRCDLLQVKIQPTHRSGMGLKPKIMMKVVGQHQRINIRRSLNYGEGDKGGAPSTSSGTGFGLVSVGERSERALFPEGRGLGVGRK